MNRVLSAYMPGWSIDLIRRRQRRSLRGDGARGMEGARATEGTPDRREDLNPILVVATTANRQIVAECCERCRCGGVRSGMTLAHARALLREGQEPIVRPHEPQRDEAALRALAVWASRFAPIVAVDPPEGLLLDVSGCERYFGGEARLLERVVDAIRRLGFHVRAAIGPTVGCAWALARFADRRIVRAGEEREALAPLPIEALRLDVETIEALHEVAVDRVGHLLDLARADLAVRFGEDLLLRLDQALGQALETLDPVRPVVPLTLERTCAGPTRQLEAILLAGRELLAEVCAALRVSESGALRLEIVFDRTDAPPVRHVLALSAPGRDEKHLWKLLRSKIESTNLGFGVERMALTVAAMAGVAYAQMSRWTASEEPMGHEQALGEFLDRLEGRFVKEGRAALWAELVESHVPERAFRLRAGHEGAAHGRGGSSPSPSPSPSPRPPLLRREPQPIEVMAVAPEGPLVWLRCGRRAAAIVASIGPERIAWEWWREERRTSRFYGTRDYYAVQDEHGRWLWVYRHVPTNTWFLHGEWA